MPFANSQRSIANSRISIGDFELTAVSDGIYRLDGGALFGIVPKVLWSKRVAADERNLVPVGLNSVLVRTGEKNILIENGIGNKLSEKMIEIYGEPAELLDKLNASGVSPDEIDIVINSHLHFDVSASRDQVGDVAGGLALALNDYGLHVAGMAGKYLHRNSRNDLLIASQQLHPATLDQRIVVLVQIAD